MAMRFKDAKKCLDVSAQSQRRGRPGFTPVFPVMFATRLMRKRTTNTQLVSLASVENRAIDLCKRYLWQIGNGLQSNDLGSEKYMRSVFGAARCVDRGVRLRLKTTSCCVALSTTVRTVDPTLVSSQNRAKVAEPAKRARRACKQSPTKLLPSHSDASKSCPQCHRWLGSTPRKSALLRSCLR